MHHDIFTISKKVLILHTCFLIEHTSSTVEKPVIWIPYCALFPGTEQKQFMFSKKETAYLLVANEKIIKSTVSELKKKA